MLILWLHCATTHFYLFLHKSQFISQTLKFSNCKKATVPPRIPFFLGILRISVAWGVSSACCWTDYPAPHLFPEGNKHTSKEYKIKISLSFSIKNSAHMWRSKDKSGDEGLSFQHVDPRDGIQFIRLGSRRFYPLSHPDSLLQEKQNSSRSAWSTESLQRSRTVREVTQRNPVSSPHTKK